jgi:fructokinase
MRIGIDLGGTKIEALALDDAGGELYRRRIATPAGDYPATLDAIVALVRQLEDQTSQRGSIGIGMPGAISPATGLMKNANSTCLIGKPFDRDVQAALGRPVRLENDANCLVLSEATDGAGAGFEVVFAVVLGTGVGGGIAVRGRVVRGRTAIAGEWGHNPMPWPSTGEWPGLTCYCGRQGCIETMLSGPGLADDHRRMTGRELTAQEVVVAAENGDTGAEATLRRYERRLAKGLAGIINLLDPDVIVVGGGLSNIERLYRNVPAIWPEYVFSDQVVALFRPALHGDSSGVRGAAWLWPAQDSG